MGLGYFIYMYYVKWRFFNGIAVETDLDSFCDDVALDSINRALRGEHRILMVLI